MDQTNSNSQCKKHPNNRLEFIQTKNVNERRNKNLFYCSACINEDLSFKGLDYILIQQIEVEGDNKILQKWPPIDDQKILEQLSQVSSNVSTHSTIEQQIINFFSVLKQEISSRIDKIQKRMIGLIKDYPLDGDSIIQRYQTISQIQEFRKLLFSNNQSDLYAKESSCREFISKIEEKKDENAQQLLDLLNKSQKKQSIVNFEVPNQIKESILAFIDQINFFNSNQKISYNSNNYLPNQPNSNLSENIMKLISNKSNYCSDQFLNEIRDKLTQLNPLLSSISFENQFIPNKEPIYFEQLTSGQLDKIGQQVKHLSQLSIDEEYRNELKNCEQINSIKQVLKNQTNFIDNNFTTEFEGYLMETYPYLRDLNTENMITDKEKFKEISTLSRERITTLLRLSQKMNRPNDQANSNHQQIVNKIKPIVNSYFDNQLQNEVNDLLENYPIFDLLQKIENTNILPGFKLEKGKKNEGHQNLIIDHQNNQILIQNKEVQWSNCVSNILLDRDKKYVFRFQIDRSNLDYHYFFIGLMKEEDIDTQNGCQNYLSCLLQQKNNENVVTLQGQDNGIFNDINKKGYQMNCSNGEEIELRVCLQEEILEVLDYPNYTCKIGVSHDRRKNLRDYKNLKLYIGLLQPVTKVILKYAMIVQTFQS